MGESRCRNWGKPLQEVKESLKEGLKLEKIMKVIITDQDLLLFKYLFESKFLSRNHIRKFIYEGFNPGYVDRRLWKLNKSGFVRKVPIATRETIIMPTEKSLNMLDIFRDRVIKLTRKNGYPLKFFPANTYECYLRTSLYDKDAPINFKEFAHDNMVNEMRFLLEDKGALYWISNNVFRNREIGVNNPDGFFKVKYYRTFKSYNKDDIPKDALNVTGPVIDDEGNTCYKFDYHKYANVAIEYERSMKRRSRYIGGKNDPGIMRRYAQDRNFDFIIYVAGDSYVYNGLAKILQPNILKVADIPHALDKFYLIHERDLLLGNFDKLINPHTDKVCPIVRFLK